jgi:hypothetical protein
MLVEEGADVEALGDEGDGPLHLAAGEGHVRGTRRWSECLWRLAQTWRLNLLVESGRYISRHKAGTRRWCECCWRPVQTWRLKKLMQLRRCTSRQKKGIWRL